MKTDVLKAKILDLLIKGELTSKWREEHKDVESADVLLEKIRSEKEKKLNDELIAKGKRPTAKVELSEIAENDKPFNIPSNWKWCRLSSVSSEILYGVSESAKETGAYKLLRITDIQNNRANWNTVPYTDFDTKAVKSYLLKRGDILFARTGGTVGKSYLVDECPTNAIYASYLIRVRLDEDINYKFVKLFFESPTYWAQIVDKASGSGQPNCNGTKLSNLILPLPPLEEQKETARIAERLISMVDDMDSSYSNLEDLSTKAKTKILDLLIKGELTSKWREEHKDVESADVLLEKIRSEKEQKLNNELIAKGKKPTAKVELSEVAENDIPFNIPKKWRWCRLGDIAEAFIGLTYKPTDKSEKGTFVLRSSNIQNNKIDLSDEVRVSCEVPEKLFVEQNDILMCSRNGSRRLVGKSILIKELPEKMVFGAFMTIIKSPVNFYLIKFFNSPLFVQQVNDICNTTTINQITLGKLNNFLIPIPPSGEQKEIVRIADTILNQIDSLTDFEPKQYGDEEDERRI